MEWILGAVALIAVASLFVIDRLCRHFGIGVKRASYVLCAALTIGVNALAISMGTSLDRGQYLRLGALIVGAAAIVTAFNEFLLSRDHATSNSIEGSRALFSTILQRVMPLKNRARAIAHANKAKQVTEPIQQNTVDSSIKETPVEITIDLPRVASEPLKETSIEKASAQDESAQIIQQPVTKQDTHISNEKTKPLKATTIHNEPMPHDMQAEQPLPKQTESPSISPSISQKEIQPKTAPVAKETTIPKVMPVATPKSEPTTPLKTLPIRKSTQVSTSAPDTSTKVAPSQKEASAHTLNTLDTMNTLDVLLRYANSQKKAAPNEAIKAYQKAIRLFGRDEYAPYLYTGLSGLYKEQGAYRDAAKICQQALQIPSIANNDAMRKEFQEHFRYLGVVLYIMTKHHAPTTPFSKIPEATLQEIERVYHSLQASANKDKA